MKRKLSLLYIMILLCICGCKEEGRIDHIDNSTPAPAPIAVQEVMNRPGGAVIKYKMPDDENLLGVKVVYIRNGEICESKASKYVDTLSVEGFGNTDPQDVKLYSVGVNGKLSEPVVTTVHPLLPPVKAVKFDLEATFGGMMISISENYSKASLAVVLMGDTLNNLPGKGRMASLQTFHTEATAKKFARRGLGFKPILFGVYLRDRWNNVSDTIYKTLTPLEEIKLPTDKFKNAMLPTDYYTPTENNNSYSLEKLWDGGTGWGSFYASSNMGPMPQWFTISLGRKMSISRIQKWPRLHATMSGELYTSTAPRQYQIWGSDNPNPNGSWDSSWHLLGEFEQIKPSGYGEGREVGPITTEDKDYWFNRTEFDLTPTDNAPDPYQTVSYLRIKILSTYNTYGTDATAGQVIIGDLVFWGQLR